MNGNGAAPVRYQKPRTPKSIVSYPDDGGPIKRTVRFHYYYYISFHPYDGDVPLGTENSVRFHSRTMSTFLRVPRNSVTNLEKRRYLPGYPDLNENSCTIHHHCNNKRTAFPAIRIRTYVNARNE